MEQNEVIHELKILPQYYNDVIKGIKKFELRKDDRGYKVGDFILLKEYDNKYTGREILLRVIYILRNCETYGLKEGYCILGF